MRTLPATRLKMAIPRQMYPAVLVVMVSTLFVLRNIAVSTWVPATLTKKLIEAAERRVSNTAQSSDTLVSATIPARLVIENAKREKNVRLTAPDYWKRCVLTSGLGLICELLTFSDPKRGPGICYLLILP